MPSRRRPPGLLIYQTDGAAGYYCYNGSAWNPLATSGGSGSGGGADSFWKANAGNISYTNSGYVGIGTTNPSSPLTIFTSAGYGFGFGLKHTDGTVSLQTYVGGNAYLDHTTTTAPGGWIGTQSDHPFYLIANGGHPKMTISTNGNVGIGVDVPTNTFQIGSFSSNPPVGASLAVALNNGGSSWALNYSTVGSYIIGSDDMAFEPQNGNGHIGINTNVFAPVTNTLQIGDMGGYGYNGNDFAIGHNGNDFGIAQLANNTQISSTSNIVFLPGTGKIGINTTTPQASLDVASSYSIVPFTNVVRQFSIDADDYDNGDAFWYTPGNATNISIIASGEVYASAFDAYSDLRIKNLLGTSDGKRDLASINSLRIRDYTMKDRMKYGNRPFKKVIAQEVEQVYPQLVSKHINFIPNVYQLTDTISQSRTGCILHFKREHHIGDTAKKLQVVTEQGALQSYDIVAVPSANEVIINAPEIKASHVFVYGEQVPDFRTVDYEGLTTLNISATQEISREVDDLKKALAAANENIRVLAHALRRLSRPPVGNRLASTRYTPSTHTKQTKKI
jgi:hypothetical protein